MLKVSDIMISDVVSVSPSAPAIEIAQKMKETGLGMVTVCNDGKYKGAITEGDIVTKVVAKAYNPKREHARSLMRIQYPTVAPWDDLGGVAEQMLRKGIRVMPVVQNGKLLGVLTLDSLLRENPALSDALLVRNSENAPVEEAGCGTSKVMTYVCQI